MGLLAVIALLLGSIIAMLPDTIGPDRVPAAGTVTRPPADDPSDRPGEWTSETEQQDEGSTPQHEPPVRQPQEVGVHTDADTPSDPDRDPAPQEAVPLPDDPETGDLWWLPAAAAPPDRRGPLALVLDDAGNSLEAYDRFLEFPGPMAVAVLPQLDYSVQAAALAAAAGKEIMLHQPMEALRGGDPGPGSIGPADPLEKVSATIRENLRTVPGAIGVNNHMGSLATTDTQLMRTVLATLHDRGLFFLDSRTTADTVGRSVAAEVGIPFAERAVFLDNWRTRESILSALGHALELSQRGEPVVMIGHVTVPLLAEILLDVYPVLYAHGYEFVPISKLVGPVTVARGGGR